MLRNLVPALGALALCSTASAQEIAKGLFLDGWLDTTFQGSTSNQDGVYSNTDFGTAAAIKVGWNINDKASAKVTLRTNPSNATDSVYMAEGYGTVKATNELTVSVGKSYGPIGYYAAEPTGLYTVTSSLTQTYLYTVNPVGVWATYAPNDKTTVTVMVADGFVSNAGPNGKPSTGKNDTNDASYALDLGYSPTSEIALNLEGFIDPSAGKVGADGKYGSASQIGFNAQYKKDPVVVGAEVIYRLTENSLDTTKRDFNQYAWSVFGSYALPSTPVPAAVTAQLSQLVSMDVYTDGAGKQTDSSLTKAQLALLTNPLGSTNFGLNVEVFYVYNNGYYGTKPDGVTPADGASVGAYGVAIEGLFVIP